MDKTSVSAGMSDSERMAKAFNQLRQGDLDGSRAVFADYMHHSALGADAHRGLAAVAWQRRQAESAIQLLREAVRIAPDHAEVRADIALTLLMAGQADESLEHWLKRIELKPDDAPSWHNLGKAFAELKRVQEAVDAFERAILLDPAQAGSYVTCARTLEGVGNTGAAESVWRRAMVVPNAQVAGYLGLGELLFKQSRLEDALEVYREGVIKNPKSPDLRLGFAQMLEDFADRAGAEAEFRQALDLRPGWAMPLEGLLTLVRGEATDADIELARSVLADPNRTIMDRANVGFGLGKTLDAKGDAEGAFSAWEVANASRRQQIGPYDQSAAEARVTRLIEMFSSDFARQARGFGLDDPRPVFVVGMPRSGTSLVEQIISSHPDAYGYGELSDIPMLAKGLPERLRSIQRWPEVVAGLTKEHARDVAQKYLDSLMQRERTDAARLVDKAPTNFFYVGFILTLFPNAHVVWCERDPRDIGVSVFAENFGLQQKYATDLADIGHYIVQSRRIMRHWNTLYGDRIYSCNYEKLVSDSGYESRQLIEAIGLPWDENCLRFYEHERPVLTPSRWQVRSPIYRGAAARWKRYGESLRPLIDALEGELSG